MGESRISCPHCGGNIAFPKEMAGQAIACPHCQVPIILGRKSRAILWAAIGITFLFAFAGSAILLWRLGKGESNSPLRPSAETMRVFEKKEIAGVQPTMTSGDDGEIEALCRAIYARSNERDFGSMHELIATPCKAALTADDLGNEFTLGGVSYRFLSIESITYSGPSGRLARARVRRAAQGAAIDSEGVREFKCVKEAQGWRLFRDIEWIQKVVAEFGRTGFAEEVRSNGMSFCSSDPFDKWPTNPTNAFERVYDVVHPGSRDMFPWDLSFSIVTNYVDGGGSFLKVGFSVQNRGNHTWETPGLRLELKQRGRQVLEDFVLLSNLGAGNELSREESFILGAPLKESTAYDLNASYTLSGGETCFLAAKRPIEFKLQRPSESIKFEVIKRSFNTTKSDSGNDMLVARVDYRVSNVGSEPLKLLELKFVWLSTTDVVIDQTPEYAVGYGDLPLAVHQTKYGFVRCGKGYTYQRVPVKVDIYLEDGERHWPLYKGMLVE